MTQPVLNSLTAAGYKLICFDHADKIVEEIAAVVRARCTLGMVLHTECRFAFYTDPFNAVIVQVHMCYFYIGMVTHCFGINAKTVVLRGNLAKPRNNILNRVIQPLWPWCILKVGISLAKASNW